MKIYYAHSMHLYNTPQEERDIKLLEFDMGFEVLNPNSEEIQEEVKKYRKKHGDDKVMEYFNSILDSCDGLAFRSHVDTKIPSGVGYEINYMQKNLKPVFELPNLPKNRYLDVEETRQYLYLNGQR